MGAAAKTALLSAPDPDDTLSVAELYADFTGEEIFAASQETSRAYNGQVLAKAILIVQTRTRCSDISALSKRLGWSRGAMYRHLSGSPANDSTLRHSLHDLASFLEAQPR